MLGEVAELLMGNSPPGDTYNENEVGLPLINGPAEYGSRHPKPVKWTSAPSRICKRGDVLVCVRGNTTGRVNIADTEYCIGRGIAAIRGKPSVSDTEFLSFVLQWKADRILELATGGGSTFPNITKPQLEELPVPGFYLPEQAKIAEVLRTVQRAKEATEKVIAATRQLKASLMKHLFTYGPVPLHQADMVPLKDTEIGPIPDAWQVVPLGEVCDFRGGTQPPKRTFIYEPREGYIRLLQIRDFDTDEHATYVKAEGKLRMAVEDDILIGRYGASVGKILRGKSGAINVAIVKALPDELHISKDYLYYLLQGDGFQGFVRSLGGRAAQAGFNRGELKSYQIPLPKLDEQGLVAGMLESVGRRIMADENRSRTLESMFKTLLHHLMTGKVRLPGFGGRTS
ncbi:MAG: restriction endonuclease subunit S [candidate division NC10 bacterium]|nr:restriction endonuclease subunit S [candidate division NC10 bacterium]